MRASSTFAFGAAAVFAVCVLASFAPAHADPAYSSENVVQIFLKQKGALTGGKTSRPLCWNRGRLQEAGGGQGAAAGSVRPPGEFRVQLGPADADGAGKFGPVREGDQRSAARRLEI